MSITVVPSPFECCSYTMEHSLYSKCSYGSGNQHCFPWRWSAGARVGTWISWQGSLGLFPEKSLCLAGGGASQAPLWEVPGGNRGFGEGLGFGFGYSSSGHQLLLCQQHSFSWVLGSAWWWGSCRAWGELCLWAIKLLLGEKDSSAPDKCPWGLTYSPNMLDMMTFGITPKPECQHLCFYLKWWEAIMGEFPAFVSLQRPLPAGPGLSPFNFCCIYGANESFPNRKCLLTLRSIQYLYCHSVTCLCALSLRETKIWVNFLWIWSTL